MKAGGFLVGLWGESRSLFEGKSLDSLILGFIFKKNKRVSGFLPFWGGFPPLNGGKGKGNGASGGTPASGLGKMDNLEGETRESGGKLGRNHPPKKLGLGTPPFKPPPRGKRGGFGFLGLEKIF